MNVLRGINLRLSPDLLAEIDDARGDVARVVWIRRAIQMRLGRTEENVDHTALLAEQGRVLASRREDLIATGVDPAELVVPLAPKEVVTVIPEGCSHPKGQRKVYGWGTICGLCNAKVS